MLSYKDVITCKTWIGNISYMRECAVKLGYEYLLWNDRVYKVLPFCNNAEDTGLTAKDVV